MNVATYRRLDRLERRFQQRGCATCSTFEWSTGIAFVMKGEMLDTEGAFSPDVEFNRPEVCPHCGRHVPITQVYDFGGVGWDIV